VAEYSGRPVAVRPHQVRARAAGRAVTLALPASVVLAAALPILFLHVDYQPGFTVHTGGANEHVVLSDLVLLAVGIAALVSGLRRGFAPLRAGWPIWIAGGVFLLDVAAGSVYPKLWASGYEASTHAVTAAKFAEYALLALAVPLLVRTRRDVEIVAGTLIAWSVVATTAGLAQIFGAAILEAWTAGRRQPSFLGHHDFASLSGAVLAIGLVALALRPVWRLRTAVLWIAVVSGVLGTIISGSSAGAIGLAIGIGALALATRWRGWLDGRRALAIGAIAAVTVGGVFVMRAGNINEFLRFVGVGRAKVEQNGVQSYVQRTLLVYIGWRIFEDNPIGGAGWQASSEQRVYGPYLPAAHREFPGTPELAFPSPEHPWGVQNAYVQAMSDLGVVGLIAFLSLLASAVVMLARPALRGPPGVAVVALVGLVWLVLTAGVLSALGLVAGIPTDALLWLTLGCCVLAAGGKELVRAG
jgi:O-antigen ligase/polysaccharide polymerase Wzy-like membrane protein